MVDLPRRLTSKDFKDILCCQIRTTPTAVRISADNPAPANSRLRSTSSLPPAREYSEPEMPSYGLRIERRTARSITLSWLSDNSPPCPRCIRGVPVFFPCGPCPHYELQMQKHNSDGQLELEMENNWIHVYKGHWNLVEVRCLEEDVSYSFRLKKNYEIEWGSTVEGATERPPLNSVEKLKAEELDRAICSDSEEEVRRFIGSTDGVLMRKLLRSHGRDGMTHLMIACENENLEMVKMLVEAGSDINFASAVTEETALMLVCFHEFLEIVEYLDQSGADWSLRDRSGCNAIHHSVVDSSLFVLRYTLAGHCPLDIIDERDNYGETPLMKAVGVGASMEGVKLLLKNGADVNSVDNSDNNSILMAAVRYGNAVMVDTLLEYGADPNYNNWNSDTPLDVAENQKDVRIMRLIEEAGGRTGDYTEYEWRDGDRVYKNLTKEQVAGIIFRMNPRFTDHEYSFLDELPDKLRGTFTLTAKYKKRKDSYR